MGIKNKIAVLLMLIITICALASCSSNIGQIASVEIDMETFQESYDINSFDISQINLLITFVTESEDEEAETEVIPLTKTMIKAEDHGKLSVVGTHTITVTYKQFTFDFQLVLAEGAEGVNKVIFQDENGNVLLQQNVPYGESATPPKEPAKEKHSFTGWVNAENSQPVDLTSIYYSLTLKPRYIPDFYNVRFLGEDSTTVLASVEVRRGGNVDEAQIPTMDQLFVPGKTFIGWLGSLQNINSDTDVVARYEQDKINVIFKYGFNGSDSKTVNYAVGERIVSAPVTHDLTNSVFLNWYTNPDFEGSPAVFPYVVNNEMTFYAKYVSITLGSENLHYTEMGLDCQISGYDGNDETIVIPETYNGKKVTGINSNAFKDAKNKRFYVTATNEYFSTDNGVLFNRAKTILYAYPSGKTEQSYSIPLSVEKIGAYAFYNATSLVYLEWGSQENALESIEDFAFSEATSLANFYFPKSVKIIGKGAFKMSGENALTTITFADNSVLEEIKEEAFAGLSRLVSIKLPSLELASLAAGVFNGCYALTKIEISETSDNFANDDYGALYTKNYDELIYYPANNLSNLNYKYEINSATTLVRAYAFEGANLVGIVFPANLATLENDAVDSIKLRYVEFKGTNAPNLPGSGAIFGKSNPFIFIPQGSLANYDIFDGLGYQVSEGTSENGYYFHDDTGFLYGLSASNEITIYGLKPVSAHTVIPSKIDGYNVKTIGHYAFYENTIIETVTIEEGLTTISDYAFAYVRNLKTLYLPVSLTTIGTGAFSDCENLITINAQETIALSSVGDEAFVKTPWYDDSIVDFLTLGRVLVKYNGTGLSAELPDNVRVIGHSAFENKTNLTSIILPDNLQRIESFAFYGCTGIFYIIIPSTVTYIGESAFLYCDNLYRIVMQAFTPPTLSMNGEIFPTGAKGTKASYSIADQELEFKITVPTLDAESTYQSNAAWVRYASVIQKAPASRDVTFASGTSYYTLENVSTLFEPYNDKNLPQLGVFAGWYPNASVDTSPVVFPRDEGSEFYARWVRPDEGSNGLEYVSINGGAEYAVSGYSGSDTYVIIPQFYKNKEVTKILSGAFSNKADVYKLVVPSTVTEIEQGALTNTNWYKQFLGDYVYINNILIEYRGEARKVVVPDFIRYIMKGAFQDNDFIYSIKFPDGLTTLPEDALEGCDNLIEVILPQSLSIIKDNAFANCRKLAAINFPDNINEVSPSALDNTAWLNNYSEDLVIINKILYKYKGNQKSLHIPTSVKTADNRTFTLEKIEREAFKGNIYLLSVYIPVTIRIIGESAFEGCIALTNVQLATGSNLTYIADRAFSGCIILVNFNIGVATTLAQIGSEAFYQCSSLASLEVPAAVTSIGAKAYMGSGIKFVQIAEGSKLKTIEPRTFMECTNLITVSIGANAQLTRIAESAFEGAINLISFVVFANVPITYIEQKAFRNCGLLRNADLPVTLEEIGENAFEGVDYMESGREAIVRVGSVLLKYKAEGDSSDSVVVISKDIVAISKDAFKGNTTIRKIIFEEGSKLSSIGEGAFMGCVNLTEINFPSTLNKIGMNAFEGTAWLVNQSDYVVINSILVRYKNAEALQATVPDTVHTIADGAFSGANNLENIIVSANVTKIGANVFDGLPNLAYITMLPINPPQIHESNEDLIIRVENTTVLAAYRENASWNTYTIEVLRRYTITFDMGKELPQYSTATLVINGTERTSISIDRLFEEPTPILQNYTFAGWYFTFNGDLGYSREEAGAFENKLTLPFTPTANVTIYAKWVSNFTGTPLGEFTIPQYTQGTPGIMEDGRYIVHSKAADNDLVIPGIFGDSDIIGIVKDPTILVENIASALDTRVMNQLSAQGVEDVYNIDKSNIPVTYKGNIYSLQYLINAFTSGDMTIAGGTAVFTATYQTYTVNVTLVVSYDAFANKNTMSEINFVENSKIKYIGEGVFENCTALTRITLPASVRYIGRYAFRGCTSLEEVIFLGGTENLVIEEGAFEGCTKLRTITLPTNVTTIGPDAFKDCDLLESVTILAQAPPIITDIIFNIGADVTIYVPSESVDAYRSIWSDYEDDIFAII